MNVLDRIDRDLAGRRSTTATAHDDPSLRGVKTKRYGLAATALRRTVARRPASERIRAKCKTGLFDSWAGSSTSRFREPSTQTGVMTSPVCCRCRYHQCLAHDISLKAERKLLLSILPVQKLPSALTMPGPVCEDLHGWRRVYPPQIV